MKSPNCGTVKCNVVASVPAGLGHACGGSFEPIFPVRRLSTLIRRSVFSIDLRQEPYEVILHVRICAGDGQQWPFLPRPYCARIQSKANLPTTGRQVLGRTTCLNQKSRVPIGFNQNTNQNRVQTPHPLPISPLSPSTAEYGARGARSKDVGKDED